MTINNLSAKERDCFFVFDNFLGDSEWARRIRRRVLQSSTHRFNAFITGPVGTGKRLIARALHEHGPRRSQPFIPVDCSTLPGQMSYSQLFGKAYRETTTLGCFRAAHGGTIYLGNVERLDHDTQRELLNVCETNRVVPEGTMESHFVDVRVIVGSKNNLESEVKSGRLRADLYKKLCVLGFETTSLRSRPSDVIPIANHFAAKLTFERGLCHKQFGKAALERMMSYEWPRNVQELYGVVDKAIGNTPSDADTISSDAVHLPALALHEEKTWTSLAELELQHIQETLIHTRGDNSRAAELLGIDRAELEEKLARLFPR